MSDIHDELQGRTFDSSDRGDEDAGDSARSAIKPGTRCECRHRSHPIKGEPTHGGHCPQDAVRMVALRRLKYPILEDATPDSGTRDIPGRVTEDVQVPMCADCADHNDAKAQVAS